MHSSTTFQRNFDVRSSVNLPMWWRQ